MNRFKLGWIVAALALVSPAFAQTVGKRAGQVFPDIELPTISGEKTVRLSDMRGKRILLVEFASW